MLFFLVALLSTAAMLLCAQAQFAIYEQYLLQGSQFQNDGRYTEAAVAYNAALGEVERRLGPEHITAAEILFNIGSVRVLQHDYSGAKMVFERSLSIREKALVSKGKLAVGIELNNVRFYHKTKVFMPANGINDLAWF